MAETVTNRGKYLASTGGLSAADLRMCYFTGTAVGVHEPDINFVSDLEAVTGVSVAADRVTLANETITEDDTNNRVNFDADAAVFPASAVTAEGVAVYVEGASDAARAIVAIYTTNFPQPVNGGLTVNIADYMRAS